MYFKHVTGQFFEASKCQMSQRNPSSSITENGWLSNESVSIILVVGAASWKGLTIG